MNLFIFFGAILPFIIGFICINFMFILSNPPDNLFLENPIEYFEQKENYHIGLFVLGIYWSIAIVLGQFIFWNKFL